MHREEIVQSNIGVVRDAADIKGTSINGLALDAIARFMESAERLRLHLDGKALSADERADVVDYDEAVGLLNWRLGGVECPPLI